MTRLYKRAASVTILPAQIKLGEDFRFAFSIDKLRGTAGTSGPSSGKVSVYNLSKSQREQVMQSVEGARSPAPSLILEAGYEDMPGGPPAIAIMDIMRAEVEYATPDIVLTLECMDGASAFRNFLVSESFAEGYTVRDALKRVAQL